MNHPFRKFLSVLCLFTVLLAGLHSGDAEAKRKKNRTPRFQRANNSSQCSSYSWRPSAKSVPSGRAANSRVPYMTNKVHAYLTALNARGCGLTVQSTYRDCVTNRNVGGVQKSRHLCGSGADTSGCSKRIAAAVCAQQGMTYIEEGRAKLPHCQANGFCNQIPHD